MRLILALPQLLNRLSLEAELWRDQQKENNQTAFTPAATTVDPDYYAYSGLTTMPTLTSSDRRLGREEEEGGIWPLLNDSSYSNMSSLNSTGDPFQRTTGELVVGTLTFVVIMLMTIGGNTLVILSVFTHRPLNKVQNYFLVSLAAADLAVAVLVTPFHVIKFIMGKWIFGFYFCQTWLTFDILCCTASILNLCAIALDRYWAIHDPIEYASKRTLRLVLSMIAIVWGLSVLISAPPVIGWNNWEDEALATTCELTTSKGFVVYSSCGSFFIPLVVMATVYAKIFVAARQRLRNKRRSVRGLSTNSVVDGEDSAKNSRKAKKAAKKSGGLAADTINLVPKNSNAGTNGSAVTSDDRVPMLTRRNTGASTIAEGQSSSGGVTQGNDVATTPLGTDGRSVLNISPVTPMSEQCEKAVLLKEQNGVGLTSSISGLSISASMKRPSPARQSMVNRLNRLTTKGQPVSREASMRGLPRRDDSMRSSVTCHMSVQSYIKDRERISVTKEKKAAKTLAVIMGVFVLCWLPFFVTYLLKPFLVKNGNWRLHPKVEEAITWLGYINSAINPVIYTIFNLDFRRAFQKFLCPFRPANAGERN